MTVLVLTVQQLERLKIDRLFDLRNQVVQEQSRCASRLAAVVRSPVESDSITQARNKLSSVDQYLLQVENAIRYRLDNNLE